jgi:heme-binding NEAT domain protein
MDQNFFGSEVIETAVLAPPDMLTENADHKYQSIPLYDEDNLQGKAASLIGDDVKDEEEDVEEDDDEEEEDGSTEKPELPKETERNQDKVDEPKSLSVNYGYHPIIDFFDRYRFDAAA